MIDPLPSICSVTEAAKLIGVSEKRVLVFIDEKRIKAKQLKREWAISLPSVRAFLKKPRKPGPLSS